MTACSLDSIIKRVDEFTISIDSLKLEHGEICALTGANGSGKTTLLDIMGLVSKPDSGKLSLNGAIIDHNDPAVLQNGRRNMGYLMQNPYLFNMSVLKNICYGLLVIGVSKRIAHARAAHIMNELDLTHLSNRNAHSLSKGESQRTALARTLVIDAPIYLLDEPTANVDKKNVKLIEEMIIHIKKRRKAAVILSTHSSRQADRLADRIIELDSGRVL